jgi:hypothetical protein
MGRTSSAATSQLQQVVFLFLLLRSPQIILQRRAHKHTLIDASGIIQRGKNQLAASHSILNQFPLPIEMPSSTANYCSTAPMARRACTITIIDTHTSFWFWVFGGTINKQRDGARKVDKYFYRREPRKGFDPHLA